MKFKRKKEQNPLERPRMPMSERMVSSKVFSYYNSGARQGSTTPVQAEKSVHMGTSNRLRLVPTMIAITIIILSLLFSLTISAKPSVSTLNDQASPYRPLDDYAKATDEIISQKLSNKSKVTIQTDEVERQLMERFPELNAVVLRLPVLGRKPSLVIDIKPPALLLATPSDSFVLDNSGVIISGIEQLPQEYRKGLLVVKDESGLQTDTGMQVLPTDTVNFIYEIVRQLDAGKIKIESLNLPPHANELDIKLEGLPYFIKTDVSGDPRLQIGSFLAVKDAVEREGIAPKEYVDVRVEEKVFYK